MTVTITRKQFLIGIASLTLIAGGVFWYYHRAQESGSVFRNPAQPTVYVTNSGKKYHRDGCKWLKSKIAMSLDKAIAAGYEPCKVCKPPVK